MSNHVTEQLNAYMDSELKGKQLRQVEDHLAECEACQAELDSLQGLSALLQEVPAPEFTSNERFVTQVNLLLPERRSATPRNSLLEIGWWMIPVGLLAAWIFISTSSLLSSALSVADNFGLIDSTTALISDSPPNAAWSSTFERVGLLDGESLQWARSTESITRNVLPRFIWQASIALMYLTWIAIWWARQTRHARQPHGQPLEG
ncbi:MAG TPA: zf-HC2 domain-containing protein [Anaerolineales bacterium]|nr:zf-HC2 domain-containing protein [Anaerolineales bacterium]